MTTLFARHKVASFAAWKRAYDEFDAERQTMGVTGHGVYRADDDPNDVTIYHEFGSVAAAKAFAASERLSEVMKNAGVLGTPSLWITTRA